MNREQLEFQISEYADGTLPAAEVAALEATLASDAEARALLEEFRKLDTIVKTTQMPLPAVDWDRFADHLSRAVAEEDRATTSIPIHGGRVQVAWWVKRVAIAAVVILAFGVAALWPRHGTPPEIAVGPKPEIPTAPAVAIVQVGGPEVASGVANVQVSIAEPSAVQQQQQANYRIAEDIIYRPPHVVIASGLADAQDSASRSSLPY
jgi:anti-sigma factor RsiW